MSNYGNECSAYPREYIWLNWKSCYWKNVKQTKNLFGQFCFEDLLMMASVLQFNLLRDTLTIVKFSYGKCVKFMDLLIFKGENVENSGKFNISVFQKRENIYMYLPAKSSHAKHTFLKNS